MSFSAVQSSDVLILTEHYGSFNHLNEDGKVVGSTTAVVREVMDQSGLDYDIKLVPWNRAYTLGTQLDNILVYAMMRTPEREEQFHWIMPVITIDLFLYGRADETRAIDYDMLKRGEITGVCLVADATCQMLLDIGLPEDRLITLPKLQRSETNVVLSGRADVFIAQDVHHLIDEGGQQASGFKPLFKLEQKQELYLVAGRQVREDIVGTVRKAYEKVQAGQQ